MSNSLLPDSSPPSSSVHEISQSRMLEWVAISFSKGSSQRRDRIPISCIGRQILYPWATREAPELEVRVDYGRCVWAEKKEGGEVEGCYEWLDSVSPLQSVLAEVSVSDWNWAALPLPNFLSWDGAGSTWRKYCLFLSAQGCCEGWW